MRILLVSNRAPVSLVKEGNVWRYEKSSGGLASGLGDYAARRMEKGYGMQWIGWPGTTVEDEKKVGKEMEKRFHIRSVFLTAETMENFYEGFCNKTLWPLFHYFPGLTEFSPASWKNYIAVNRRFAEIVREEYRSGDVIWIHDYHLLLLPAMVREQLPDASIGFFLHIPFPSYEVFRLLPGACRRALLEGMFGADLIGFHTHDYCTYFLRSTLRILGMQDHLGEVQLNNRLVKVDTFPMGINYEKYSSGVLEPESMRERRRMQQRFRNVKLVLSIDRQDYTKGILNRLKGYAWFLEHYPEWRGRVTLTMVVIPSRIGVDNYQKIKDNIDSQVGSINGTYGDMHWTPVIYQYRSVDFHELMALYSESDVALVTPLRDGMNLIAKEYVAGRTDHNGVLILSEMAGAVEELDQALVIPPNNIEAIGTAILQALEMKPDEQRARMETLQARVRNYDVFHWADDFLSTLRDVKKKQSRLKARVLDAAVRRSLLRRYKDAASRLLFLDYDGTLVPHVDNPADASPPTSLLDTLQSLSGIQGNRIVIISGRDRQTLDKWFGTCPVELAAEHGLFLKVEGKWRLVKPVRKNWKRKILPVLRHFADRLPGARIEHKEHSLAFHYRKSDAALANLRVRELAHRLSGDVSQLDMQLLHGDKTLEVRNAGVDKGLAALHWLKMKRRQPSFILAVGNDDTDEDLFRALPRSAVTVRVGWKSSHARYNLPGNREVLELLQELSTAL